MTSIINAGEAAAAANVVAAAGEAAIAEAARLLRAGQLVAFPTETVYGLGADATNGHAVARIFAAKGRPRFNPLIVHVPHARAAERLGRFEPRAERLAQAFWPGPLTIVVEAAAASQVADLATAGLPTIALRVPAHPVAQALLEATGRPLAAPSANRSGHVSPTTAAHVAADLGDAVAMVLDAGSTAQGIESTIIACLAGKPARLLRPGAVPRADIERVLCEGLSAAPAGRVEAPGQMRAHYAPGARLRLDAAAAGAGEALVGFGPPPPGTRAEFSLSETGDLVEAAARLFAVLRELDTLGIKQAAVMPIPHHGLGEAINDRLARAAAAHRSRR